MADDSAVPTPSVHHTTDNTWTGRRGHRMIPSLKVHLTKSGTTPQEQTFTDDGYPASIVVVMSFADYSDLGFPQSIVVKIKKPKKGR